MVGHLRGCVTSSATSPSASGAGLKAASVAGDGDFAGEIGDFAGGAGFAGGDDGFEGPAIAGVRVGRIADSDGIPSVDFEDLSRGRFAGKEGKGRER